MLDQIMKVIFFQERWKIFYLSKVSFIIPFVLTHPNRMGWLRGSINIYILNVARALQMQCSLPTNLQGHSILHSVFIINLPSKVTKGVSPYELFHGRKPHYDRLRSFGCLCYATTLVRENKFSPKAKKCIYIGNSTTQKGYILYDISKEYVSISKDVTFCENDNSIEDSSDEDNIAIAESSNSLILPEGTRRMTYKPKRLNDYYCSFATSSGH